MYPPIPTAPGQQPQESRAAFGTRILRAILADPTPAPIGPILAGFTDDQLDAAERAAYYTVTARDIEPRAVDVLAHVRRALAQTQQIRASIDAADREHLAAALAQPAPPPPPPGIGGSRVARPTTPPTTPPNDGNALIPPRPAPAAYTPAQTPTPRPRPYVDAAADLAF